MKRQTLIGLLTLALVGLAALPSSAAVKNWNAGVNSNWDFATANWTGQVWANGDNAVFGATGIGAVNLASGISAADITFNNAGYTLQGGTLSLTGGGNNVITNANAAITSSIVSGSLTKSGAGDLTLSTLGNNFAGGTTVNQGRLILSGSNGFTGVIKGTLTINSGAEARITSGQWTLGYDSGSNYVDTININGGTLTFATPGQGGTNAGTFNLTGGTIGGQNFDLYNSLAPWADVNFNTFASATTSTVSSGINLRLKESTGGGTLIFNVQDGAAATDLLVSGNISGGIPAVTQRVTKTGAGTLVLSGNNTYNGVTTINQGTLSISSIANGTLASGIGASTNAAGNLVLGGGTLQYTGGTTSTDRSFTLTAGTTSTIDVSNAATNLTITGASAATNGALIKAGSGTLTLTGFNLHTGGTTVNGGTLALNNAGAGPTGVIRGALTINSGAAVQVVGNQWVLGYDSAPGAFVDSITINGGTLNFQVTGGTNAGTINMTGGSITGSNFDLYNNLAAWTNVNFNTFASATTATVSSGINLRMKEFVAGGNVIFNVQDGAAATDLLISGNISAVGTPKGITKTGAGLMVLSGNNTYNGVTTINQGTLSISNFASGGLTSNIGNSSAAATNLVLGGGTLQYTGATASTDRSFTLTAGTTSTIDIVNAATNLTMTGGSANTTGALIKSGAGMLTLSSTNNHTGGTTVNGGVLNLSGTNGPVGIVRGTLTINSGAEARITTGQWTLGYDSSSNFVDTITINGGTLNFATPGQGGTNAQTINMTGGSITGQNFDWHNNLAAWSDVNFNTFASATTATVSTGINLRMKESTTGGTLRFNVANGAAATDLLVSGVISGNALQKVSKTGAGTMVLSNLNTYGGGTTVDGGILVLQGTTSPVGVIRGALTINTGAEVQITGGQWTLGYDSAPGAYVDSITINGGTLNFTIVGGTNAQTINMTGGSIIGSSFDVYNFNTATSDVNFNILASANSSTISAPMNLRMDQGTGSGGTAFFNVADGAAATDLLVSGGISGLNNTQKIAKTGAGTMVLTNTNTYSGTTSVTGGTLDLDGTINNSGEVIIDRTTGAASNNNGRLLIDSAGTRQLGNISFGTGNVSLATSANSFGHLQHDAGTTTVANNLRVGVNSTGVGLVSVNGGIVNVNGQLLVGGNTGGGTGTVTIGVNGTLNVNSNTTIVDSPVGPTFGTLNIAGTFTDDGSLIVGQNNTGIVNHTSGNATVNDNTDTTGNLVLGQSVAGALGTYALSGTGTLRVRGNNTNALANPAYGNTFVGQAGRGIVNQTGGTFFNDSNMEIGGSVAGSQYNLSGGVLSFRDRQAGSQIAATDNAVSTLKINSTGAFNFTGGQLENVTFIDVPTGGTFRQQGGRFVIGTDGVTNRNLSSATVQAMTTIDGNYILESGGTLVVDIFGPRARATGSSELAAGTPGDPTTLGEHADLLWVQGTALLDGTLSVNLNNYPVKPWAWYDVVVANDINITDGTLNLEGISLWRIITDPSNPNREILQVANPEPASVLVWSLIGTVGIGIFFWRRRQKSASQA